MTRAEQIETLKQRIAALEAEERAEKEAEAKKKSEEYDRELTAIQNAIAAFNDRHSAHLGLYDKYATLLPRDLWFF